MTEDTMTTPVQDGATPQSPSPATPLQTGPFYAADIICGKEGTIKIGATQLPEITQWKFDPKVTTQTYASNRTNGFKRRVCGIKEGTGTIEGKWDRNDMLTDHFVEGDSVTLLLYLDATKYIECPAIITGMSMTVNINDNEVEGWTADFEADGEWVYHF